ncbi:MmpS family transport accessory protein [Actinoallomurus acaciae]|uniref:MmpS family transport accessory protein n=1 Tax=Actinoallomurus acaciae TaxID=502577 RepID=A0ABV5Y9W6_9ACTN
MRAIIIAAAAAAAIALTGCVPVENSADPNIATPAASGAGTAKAKPKTTRAITYRIGGSATRALITYTTPSGEEQQNGAHVPWHKAFKVKKDAFDVLTVSAQNSGGGTITCEIDVDGIRVKAAKSSGAYAIASCDHTLGF